jgi:hypothetical protein
MVRDDPNQPLDHRVPFYWAKVLVSTVTVLEFGVLLHRFRYPVMSTFHRLFSIFGPG